MKFNLAVKSEESRASDYFNELLEKKCVVEIKKVSPRRSLSQNAYLHLLLGAFGLHFGYELEEAKSIYKHINGDIYMYRKKGRVFVRSSADLTTDEMTRTIDRFRQKSAEQGCPLPLATNKEWLMQIENAIEQSRYI